MLAVITVAIAPGVIENQRNSVDRSNEWPVTSAARSLHAKLRIADLHADTLLWDRDLLAHGDIGHVDLPRLQEGGVVLQVMAAVTKSPSGQNYDSNSSDASDMITALTMVQLWPRRTWGSLLERALYQSEKLHAAAATSKQLTFITSGPQLQRHLADGQAGAVAMLLATEGAHPLEGDLSNLEVLWDAGYRMLGLQHFFDNELGGSLHGESGAGLTDFGRQVVQRAVAMGFIIDVAHSSPMVVDDVLELSGKPVVVSHTGVKGVCDSPRNLEDEQFRRIASAGGIIGIGYWDAVCDISPSGVAKSIEYAVGLVGEDHVALGSDYDGATRVTFDTSQLAVLTQALLDTGLSARTIRKVMGDNLLTFLATQLPAAD